MYEYKFIRFEKKSFWLWRSIWCGGLKKEWKEQYQNVIKEHAKEGWRLFQIFAPAANWINRVEFIEIILEREIKS